MRTWTARLLLAFTAVCLTLTAAVPAGADSFTDTSEQLFLRYVNEFRASRGLRQLTLDAELTDIGRRWATGMAAAGAISHNMDLPNQVRAPWRKVGENVGAGYDSAELFNAFVASPTHLANLADPSYSRIGIGVVVGADGRMYTAHQFLSAPGDSAKVTKAKPKATKRSKASKARRPVRRPARRR